jgi:hypothetical protein
MAEAVAARRSRVGPGSASPIAFGRGEAHAWRLSDPRADASAPRLRQAGCGKKPMLPLVLSCALAGVCEGGAR